MKLNSLKLIIITMIVSLNLTSAFASDIEKEKRWEEQIVDSLLDGEAVKLNDGKNDFLAIDTRADDPKEVGIIVIHGIGVHPDWETVIRPLRVQLTEEGWNTLSLQMPILSNEATGRDYQPLMKEVPTRIDAGIRYMAKNGAKKIVIVAHSMGSQMTNYYLANKKVYREAQTEIAIIGYVAIGMGDGNTKYLKGIKLPLIDIYGENDLPSVLNSVSQRALAAGSNKEYKQVRVSGANHFFEDQDEDLVKVVKDALLSIK